MHDGRVLRNSLIYQAASDNQRKEILFPNGSFLLGDAAFPCLDWLITPFKDVGNLSRDQKKFNSKHHSPTRVHNERAFGILKGRFRKLKCLDIINIADINNIVTAAVILHNICIQNGNRGEDFQEVHDPDDYDPNLFENMYRDDSSAIEKRNHLVRMVNE